MFGSCTLLSALPLFYFCRLGLIKENQMCYSLFHWLETVVLQHTRTTRLNTNVNMPHSFGDP